VVVLALTGERLKVCDIDDEFAGGYVSNAQFPLGGTQVGGGGEVVSDYPLRNAAF